MKAWQVSKPGDPAVALRLTEVAVPQPGPGEVLLKVRATALNFPDVLLTQGLYQDKPPTPFTPGIELCGDVVAVGEGATSVAVGDRVMGSASLPHGALSEYSVSQAANLSPAPAELDDAEAAAFTVAYQTGWFGLHRRAHLQAGETLLVHAAAGGVGSAAIQLGKAAGARVVGVVGTPSKVDAARSVGADEVVDRSAHPGPREFVAALRAACGPGGADVVYDPVGGAAFEASTKVVAFEGRIVIVGFAGGTIAQAATNHALVKNYGILGLYWGAYRTRNPGLIRECEAELAKLVASGAVRPYVSERLPLDRAREAVVALGEGRTTGRVVIEVAR